MKRYLLISFLMVILPASFLLIYFNRADSSLPEVEAIREKHDRFLREKKPGTTVHDTKKSRITRGLPPNRYYELMAYLTMNPVLGYPEPHKVRAIQKELAASRLRKAPGEEDDNPWIDRGPNNVGGRTRVLLFDPNDPSGERVFAGSVSGGLWVNNNITNVNSPWQQVSGLAVNLNITCITVDPRDSNTWYVGTGEQYTAGDVVGTGVYKTTDGGTSWNKVLDVDDFARDSQGNNQLVVGGIHYINDIHAWDNGTTTEVFLGVTTHIYSNAANPTNFLGFFERGLYRSTNGGSSWNRVIAEDSFNDFDTDAAGNVWVATTNSPGAGSRDRGGKIFKRERGTDTEFVEITTIPNVLRTEIEPSAINPQKFYILAEGINNEAELFITTDAFASFNKLPEPRDVDLDIPPTDFARGQAFYNLMIEADPTNDNIVYAGGIDLFRSTNSGDTWEQISRWSDNNNLENLPVSLVHADQHVMQFRPGNRNQAIFGHDGGVSFARDLGSASTSDVFITPARDYITTQFYSVAVAPTSFADGDYFLGGTQDNGTQLIENGNRIGIGILGGDGAHTFFDQVETDYLIANLVYNNLIVAYDYSAQGWRYIANNEDNDGFFINPQALDSHLDLLYSNGPEGVLYRYDDIDNLPAGDTRTAPRVSLENNLLNASISALNISPYTTTRSKLLVGLINGRLLMVDNAHGNPGEETWRNITGSRFVGSISDVEFGKSENEIYVTFYNYGVRSIWYTENGLDPNPTWVNKEGNLPDLPVLTILPNPLNPEEVIVGTELGIWATRDFLSDNPSWKQAYNGMSDVKVTDLDLRRGDNMVFAASYGRGIFSGQFTTNTATPVEEDLVLVLPTLSDGSVRIISGSTLGDTRIDVFNTIGQRMASYEYDISGGIPTNLELGFLRPGIYIVRLQAGTGTTSHKIVIQ